MLRVETVFTTYRCPKLSEDVEVRIDRLRDVETQRILSQKFECDRAAECCQNRGTASCPVTCAHPEAQQISARMESGAGS